MKRFALITGVFVALMAQTAMASHDLQTTLTVNPTTANTPAGTTGSNVYDDFVPASSTTHLPAGHVLNEEGAANAPLEGEKIGVGTVNARFWVVFCAKTTSTLNVYWDDLDNTTSEPAGSVARFKVDPTIGEDFFGYFVKKNSSDSYQTGAHYDIVIPSIPTSVLCTNNADITSTLETYAYSRDANNNTTTRWVAKNPATAGTYTGWGEYTDINNGHHDDSAQYTITN